MKTDDTIYSDILSAVHKVEELIHENQKLRVEIQELTGDQPDKWLMFTSLISAKRAEASELRLGQVTYDALYDTDPKLARFIKGSALDPFYHDDPKEVRDLGERIRVYFTEDI